MGRGNRRTIEAQEVVKPLYARAERPRGQQPWIPIAGLPLDLQLAVLRPSGPVLGNPGLRVRVAPGWLKLVAVSLLVLGLIAALTTPAAAGFGSSPRAFGLLVGGALVGVILGWRRALGFRTGGGKKLVLGPASLIIVDARHVWVVPAEDLAVEGRSIHRGTELICKSDFHLDGDWIARLRKVVKAAKASEALRDGDRFLKAAAHAQPVSWPQRMWTSREPQIVAAGLAISVGLFLEAGPLHARGLQAQAFSAATAAMVELGTQLATGRERAVDIVTKEVTASVDRKKRAEALDDAMRKSEEYARAFLTTYRVDEARPRVNQRLAELCAAKIPLPQYDVPRSHALRIVLRAGCESADGVVRYTISGDVNVSVAQSFMKDLTAHAATFSRQLTYVQAAELDPFGANLPAGGRAGGASYVQLHMSLLGSERAAISGGRAQDWRFDVVPVDALGVPIPGADYHAQATINRDQGTMIKMPGSN